MATSKQTIEFILEKLRGRGDFVARAMFGEYALYADGKVVGLICDNLFYVKIVTASNELEKVCEKGAPYPGAKPHYIVDEGQLVTIENLPSILNTIAVAAPEKKRSKTSKVVGKPSAKKQVDPVDA
jgi:TfoX/Sxy family transcriptional regulator of competence genes